MGVVLACVLLGLGNPEAADLGQRQAAKTAIKIAVAVWEPIFGEKQIARRNHIGQD